MKKIDLFNYASENNFQASFIDEKKVYILGA
jgi:hypothetical protein